MSRVLDGDNQITQKYKVLTHRGIDLVKYKSQTCNILAHTGGKVVWLQKGQKNDPKASGNASYGNCVKIKHPNGMYTLYAHMKSVSVKLNQEVSKGEVIGYMGNTGRSSGAHLHFEVRNEKDTRIDPTPYIDASLPSVVSKYRVYDNVKKKWLPDCKIGSNDYAGNFGNCIGGVQIDGYTYRVHDKTKGKWLPEVSITGDYAGNLGNNIDAVAIKNATYRVHIKGGKWLGWVNGYNTKNTSNGYAGNLGQVIDAIQIK